MKLKVNVKDVNSCEKVLTIDVPSEVVTEEFNSFYNSVAKQAKIPGFRPGHAPRQVVALHFKDEARREVWKELVARSLQDALKQEALDVIGYPRVESMEFDERRLKYKAHVEMRPKVKIDKYAGLSLKRERVRVTETEVNDALKRIQESHAKFQAVEGREARLGDFLIADYVLQADGKEVEKRDGEWVEIRDKDYLEGFSKQLLGAKPGENRTVTVTFPSDYVRKELAGTPGEFKVMIHELKEKILPSLDDELAKAAGEYESVADLKRTIEKDFENHKKVETERKLEQNLLDELIKRSKFEVPAGVIERRLNALVEDQIQSLLYRGAKAEDAAKHRDEIRKSLEQEAERQVRVSFLLDEISTREHVEAKEEDWNAKYESLAGRLRRPVEEVKSYYSQDRDRKDSLAQQIIFEKTIQWLKDKAVITEVEASS
ncbi:MAG: trigger factor [Candidatus Omnitrophica bacterium]|nr:trigger factor [Candidatus Omnitrophota bacterium]